MQRVVQAGYVSGKPLLDYTSADFPFSPATIDRVRRTVREAQHGRGVALLKGLPREGLSPEQFEVLTWAIGLHTGVARPQDKQSRYMNKVMDVGTVYRSAGGRGYSSNAELDFHVDGSDIVLLSCYNQAPLGGDSMCSSAVTALGQMRLERPDLASELFEAFYYSRQSEQAEGQSPFMVLPVYGEHGGNVFCFWNRNRIEQGQKLAGVPKLTDKQREATELLEEILRRADVMYYMRLEPGDLQILSNHTALHSRTEFQDGPDPALKRTLYRLWISTPDGPELPPMWADFYGATAAGMVRGGIHGLAYDDRCIAFDRRQALDRGMHFDPTLRP